MSIVSVMSVMSVMSVVSVEGGRMWWGSGECMD